MAGPNPATGVGPREFYGSSKSYLAVLQAHNDSPHFGGYLGSIKATVPRGARLLDCGCGTGFSTALLRQAGYDALGLDYSPLFLERGCAVTPPAIAADATRMPFPDATFDAVTSLDLIEHLERPEDFLLEMGRVLKPNGFGIIVAPNILSPFRPFKYLLRCMTGKRGLPGFYENPVACLRFSAWAAGLLLWKRLGPLPAFRYREPTLSEAQETDEDCMYYANPVDISRHLASWGYHRIKYQGEGQTAGRRLLARLAPDFAGIINIVYRKQG